jgi:hypothetical protein
LANDIAPEVQTELEAALTVNREQFKPQFIASASLPNFGQPIRRAPIRRKGRVRH